MVHITTCGWCLVRVVLFRDLKRSFPAGIGPATHDEVGIKPNSWVSSLIWLECPVETHYPWLWWGACRVRVGLLGVGVFLGLRPRGGHGFYCMSWVALDMLVHALR